MTSGIGNLQSTLARSISVPLGPAARRATDRSQADNIPPGAENAASRLALGKDLTDGNWGQAAPASKEGLAEQVENAEKAALGSTTTIQFQRDDRDGKMYIHVLDKQTGRLLYRIPEDYVQAPDRSTSDDHKVDLKV